MDTWEWDILRDRVRKLAHLHVARPLEGYALFLVQHVLDDLYSLIQALLEAGAEADDITIVGIPYSSRERAAIKIQEELGCRVVLPAIFPFDGCIFATFVECYERCRAAGKHLIVLEDGGYTVPLIAQLRELGQIDSSVVVGAVEQTTRGKWLDQRLERAGKLPVPVISIPDCHTKQTKEPEYVAQAVQRNLLDLLGRVEPGSRPSTTTVIGLYGAGTIGSFVADGFSNSEATVYITDPSPDRKYQYAVKRYEELSDETLGHCDLILGSTGSTSITSRALSLVKDGVLICSASSQQVEVDMQWLYGKANHIDTSDALGDCVLHIPAVRTYHYSVHRASRSVSILYDGYPINFWKSSLPDFVADAVLALLFEGVVTIALGGVRRVQVHSGAEVLTDEDIEISMMFDEVLQRQQMRGSSS